MSADSAWAQRRAEHGEVVGGGWFVVRRGRCGRIAVDAHRPPMEYADAADAVRAAQRLADQFPGNAYCVLKQQLEIIIHDSAASADTAAGGSGLSPDAGAVAGTPQPQLATAAGDGEE